MVRKHIHLLFREHGGTKIFLTTLKTGLPTLLISYRLKISGVYSQAVSTKILSQRLLPAQLKRRLRKAWKSISVDLNFAQPHRIFAQTNESCYIQQRQHYCLLNGTIIIALCCVYFFKQTSKIVHEHIGHPVVY